MPQLELWTLFPYTTLFRSLTGMLKRADIGTVGRHRVDVDVVGPGCAPVAELGADVLDRGDRKSTRRNSSHVAISYAVYCWRKTSGYYYCFDGSRVWYVVWP